MSMKINYEKDNYYLTDDALLYDNELMRQQYGDLIPSVKDKGTYCIFETNAPKTTPVVPVEELICDTRDHIGNISSISSDQALAAIRGAVTRLKTNTDSLTLRFPNPLQNSKLYRVLVDVRVVINRLEQEEGGTNIIPRQVERVEKEARVVILCGVECYGEQDGVDAKTVAKWLHAKAEELTVIIEGIKSAQKAASDAQEERNAQEARRRRNNMIALGVFLGTLTLAVFLAFLFWG